MKIIFSCNSELEFADTRFLIGQWTQVWVWFWKYFRICTNTSHNTTWDINMDCGLTQALVWQIRAWSTCTILSCNFAANRVARNNKHRFDWCNWLLVFSKIVFDNKISGMVVVLNDLKDRWTSHSWFSSCGVTLKIRFILIPRKVWGIYITVSKMLAIDWHFSWWEMCMQNYSHEYKRVSWALTNILNILNTVKICPEF